MRIENIETVIVPFRPPEVHNTILKFDMNRYFYFDQDWSIERRFASIDAFEETFKQWVHFKLPDFHLYTTSGTTEAITYCINDLSYRSKKIAMVENEYRWYTMTAQKLNIQVDVINSVDQLTADHVFITSVPFCKDGTVSELQQQLLDKCHIDKIECWLDCAYYGAGRSVDFRIPKSTTNMFFSFSKNFGLALNRFGVWLAKDWRMDRAILQNVAYVNIPNMELTTYLMQKFTHDYMWNNYRALQLSVTNTPTDIIFMSKDGCITKALIDKVKEEYQSF
jgi:histidinol-phosphate/aromatic aminotransferase/cobyric acid decarboxylase-like protein